jgi:hypothetical protein
MPIGADQSFIEQVGLTAAGAIVAAVVGSLIIGGYLARIARRAQAKREDRQIRDKLIDEMTRVLGAAYVRLQSYESLALEAIDGVHRFSSELEAMRKELDAAYQAASVEATAIEARLRAYFSDSIAQRWHAAWDCLSVRYFSMIIPDPLKLRAIFGSNSGPGHTGLAADKLRDGEVVKCEFRQARDEVTRRVATERMRDGVG